MSTNSCICIDMHVFDSMLMRADAITHMRVLVSNTGSQSTSEYKQKSKAQRTHPQTWVFTWFHHGFY